MIAKQPKQAENPSATPAVSIIPDARVPGFGLDIWNPEGDALYGALAGHGRAGEIRILHSGTVCSTSSCDHGEQ